MENYSFFISSATASRVASTTLLRGEGRGSFLLGGFVGSHMSPTYIAVSRCRFKRTLVSKAIDACTMHT